MKIKEAKAGALTNFEVLDFLRNRNGPGAPGRGPCISLSESKVYEYLVDSAACDQTRETVTELMEKCKRYDLANAEILNIINIRASTAVELYLVVEECETRLGDKAEELAEMVEQVLPPPPAKPKGEDDICEGEEEKTNGESMEVG